MWSLDRLIDDLRWYAFYCDRTRNGCCAAKLLFEAADALEALKQLKEDKEKK